MSHKTYYLKPVIRNAPSQYILQCNFLDLLKKLSPFAAAHQGMAAGKKQKRSRCS
jgi:hypothetical protein